jgi:hypothetical protein
MKNNFLGRIAELGLYIGGMVVSAAGCFVFMRGFRLVATGKEEAATRSSIRAPRMYRKPLVGVGAALFLLVFITSEALATVRALRH